MVFGRFRRKPKQPRGPDGKFLTPHGDPSASSAVAARGMSGDLAAVTKTLNEAFTLTNTIQEQALKGMEMRSRHRDMVDDLEGAVEDGGGMDFEQMAAQVILQQLSNAPPQARGQGDPFVQGAADPYGIHHPENQPHNAIPQAAGSPAPQAVQDNGIDRLNGVLRGLGKIPDKVISEKAIDKVCEMEGIDKDGLKSVIKKLAPVIK